MPLSLVSKDLGTIEVDLVLLNKFIRKRNLFEIPESTTNTANTINIINKHM